MSKVIQNIKCWLGFHNFTQEFEHDNPKFRFYICSGCKQGFTVRIKI